MFTLFSFFLAIIFLFIYSCKQQCCLKFSDNAVCFPNFCQLVFETIVSWIFLQAVVSLISYTCFFLQRFSLNNFLFNRKFQRELFSKFPLLFLPQYHIVIQNFCIPLFSFFVWRTWYLLKTRLSFFRSNV